MADYLFQGQLDNTVHDISEEDIRRLYRDNLREENLGKRITASSYRGESDTGNSFDLPAFYRDVLYRDPMTAGLRMYYPHGIVLEQSLRRNYYRGEHKLYGACVPTLVRMLRNYSDRKQKELYRMVSDMKIYEFSCLINEFEHVKRWDCCDVLYEPIAQHYGLDTSWLDITSDFKVALFFACCYWKDGKWLPLTKDITEKNDASRYGMIFHMPSWKMSMRWSMEGTKFHTVGDEVIERKPDGEPLRYEVLQHPHFTGLPDNLIYPLGFQPFMRCHMQNGYGIYMRDDRPLEQDIGFEKLRFQHSEKLSQWIYEEMQGGELIYPHEGLRKIDYQISQIRSAHAFSEAAFHYALQRNHFFTMTQRDEVLEELGHFLLDGQTIQITNGHPWHLGASRRRQIDHLYSDFSLENSYGIKILDRKTVPGPAPMFEPWMLMESEDEPGLVDFELRKEVNCGQDIFTRDSIRILATMMTAHAQDF